MPTLPSPDGAHPVPHPHASATTLMFIGKAISTARALARFFVALCLTISVTDVCHAARWYEDYVRAVELVETGDCSPLAIRLLGAASIEKPRSRLNARTQEVKVIDYLPYYQLARAHMACGELNTARIYLNDARDEGVTPVELLSALENRFMELESRGEKPSQPDRAAEEFTLLLAEASQTVGKAESLAVEVNLARSETRYAPIFDDNKGRLEEGTRILGEARRQLDQGISSRDVADIRSASESAAHALQIFTSIQNQIASVRQATPTATTFIPRPTPSNTPLLTPTSTHSPGPALAPPTASPTPTRLSGPPPITRPGVVPPQFRRAADHYLNAEYELLLQELIPDDFDDRRQQAAAHLLRAAAKYALYCLKDRQDQGLLSEASSELASCRTLDPAVQPDPKIFSPEFVDLYRASR